MTPSSDSSRSLASRVGSLCAYLRSDGAGPGLRAQLRKEDPDALSLPSIACVLRVAPEAGPADLRKWISVAKAIALAGPDQHALEMPLGAALSKAGLTELRLQRLIGAPAELLDDSVWRVCRRLGSSRQRFNAVEVAALLLTTDTQKARDLRLRISRDFLSV